jgi:hypothetical protein
MWLTLLDSTMAEPTPEEKLRALRYGLTLITVIGVIGVLLVVALAAAWRRSHKRLASIEAELKELRQSRRQLQEDAWASAAGRVEMEIDPAPVQELMEQGNEIDEEAEEDEEESWDTGSNYEDDEDWEDDEDEDSDETDEEEGDKPGWR